MGDGFWPAIWGALVGAGAGGAISFGLQMVTFRQARSERADVRKEAERAEALKLFFSLQRASSDLAKLRQWSLEAVARSKELSADGPLWCGFLPISNLPRGISIGSAELAVLFERGDAHLLNSVRDVEATHNAALDAWRMYGTKRQELARLLPADIEGSVGTTEITLEQRRSLAPLMAEVETLGQGLVGFSEQDAADAKDTLNKFIPILNRLTGKPLTVEFVDEGRAGAG